MGDDQHHDDHDIYDSIHYISQPNVTRNEHFEDVILLLSTLTIVYYPLIVMTNVAVLFSTINITKLHTPQNMILAFLASIDLLYGHVIIPMDIIITFDAITWNSFYKCWFRLSSYQFILSASLSFLLLMTIERFVAVNFVFHYNKITNCRIIASALIILIIEIIRGPVVVAIRLRKENETRICTHASWSDVVQTLSFDWMKIALELSIAVVLSIQVAFIAWRQNKRIKKSVANRLDRNRNSQRKETVKITIYLMFVFVIIWFLALGPSFLTSVYHTSNEILGIPKIRVFQIYSLFIKHLLSANAFINPLIYALVKPTYKLAYMFLISNKPCNWNELKYIIREEDRRMALKSLRGSICIPDINKQNSTKTNTPESSEDGDYSDQSDHTGCRRNVSFSISRSERISEIRLEHTKERVYLDKIQTKASFWQVFIFLSITAKKNFF